jgi:hypothetical protein
MIISMALILFLFCKGALKRKERIFGIDFQTSLDSVIKQPFKKVV